MVVVACATVMVAPPEELPEVPPVELGGTVGVSDDVVGVVIVAVGVVCELIPDELVLGRMKAKMTIVPRMSTAATIARIQTHKLRRGVFGGVEGELSLGIPCVGEFGLLIIAYLFFLSEY